MIWSRIGCWGKIWIKFTSKQLSSDCAHVIHAQVGMQRPPRVKMLYSIRMYAGVHTKDYFLWLEKRRYFKMICKICKPRHNNRKLLRLKDKSNLKMYRYVIRNGLKSIRILLENCINQFQSCILPVLRNREECINYY